MAHDLNAAQKAAVFTLSGPLLVLAGAGTGKTRVITYRIAQLIRHGIAPNRILAMTFTNKAAREMKERAIELLGKKRKKDAGVPEISTFHALCVRILRRHITHLGYPDKFTIYDTGEQETVARKVLRQIRVGTETLTPSDFLGIVSGWKQQSIRPADCEAHITSDKHLFAARAYEKYQNQLRANGAVDFDDLLLLTEQLFLDHADVRYAEQTRFDHLLIDEYQDTNGLQYRIVKALAERHRNICVVGDDDQSIYGWRGAEVTHILNFAKDWQGAKTVKLEENYRCRAPIIEIANRLIKNNTTRHDKVLVPFRQKGTPPRFVRFDDEEAEAESIVKEIRGRLEAAEERKVLASDIAILFRTNEQPRAFESALRRHGIPYVLKGGQSFYDRKEIKDVLAYFKVLANPSDEVSLLRIINTPPRGVGTGTIQTLLEDAVSEGVPMWQILPRARADGRLPSGAGDKVDRFRRFIEMTRFQLEKEPLVDVLTELLAVIDYRAELQRFYKDGGDVEARWNAIEELINAVGQYAERTPKPTLSGFLEETTLSDRDDIGDGKKDKKQEHAVTLMTLHSAKGLEFPHVYLVGMEEGLLPHRRSVADGGTQIQEERRLAYVGVTRARDTLTLTFAKQRMKWGKPRASIPSRFLMEMRGDNDKAQKAAAAAVEMLAAIAADSPAARAAKKAKGKKAPRRRSA